MARRLCEIKSEIKLSGKTGKIEREKSKDIIWREKERERRTIRRVHEQQAETSAHHYYADAPNSSSTRLLSRRKEDHSTSISEKNEPIVFYVWSHEKPQEHAKSFSTDRLMESRRNKKELSRVLFVKADVYITRHAIVRLKNIGFASLCLNYSTDRAHEGTTVFPFLILGSPVTIVILHQRKERRK